MSPAMRTVPYGPGADQTGDLHLPTAERAPLVCLFHGGFWRMPYGRDQLDAMARDLCARGFAVWNLSYRRVGPGGHAWPTTRDDVDACLAHLPALRAAYPAIDVQRVATVGHSAGGQLAFLAAARHARRSSPARIVAAIGLAPLLDLHAAHTAGLGNAAVQAFLGGSPVEVPERYQETSPRALLPLGVRQFVIHGEADTAVPPEFSKAYVDAARAEGDDATYFGLPGADHMAFLDPESDAHEALYRCLEEATRA